MIRVNGAPFDISTLAGQYAPASVERLVLEAMDQGGDSYSFDNLAQLEFELLLRREIVKAAQDLNKSGLAFAVFHNARCNEAYWDKTANGGFRLRQGVSPSKAINDIFINGRAYATECATAMVIVYYKALLEAFGPGLFDQTFQDIYLMDWDVRSPLLRSVSTPKKVSQLLIGDRAYFKNPDVNPETPYLQGENVIVLPDSLYYGHGVGVTTAEQILYFLNQNRKSGSNTPAFLMDSAGRPDFKSLARVYHDYRPASAPRPAADFSTGPEAIPAAAPLVWRPFPPAAF